MVVGIYYFTNSYIKSIFCYKFSFTNLQLMIKWYCFILCSFLSVFSLRAQLNGAYTAGNVTDDFPTIQDAIDSINQVGMAGTVVIQISNGSYSSIQLSNIIPPVSEKLIFVSASQNANDVIFQSGEISNCERIEFHDLSFIMQAPGTEYSLIKVLISKDVRLLRCRIVDSYNTDTVWNFAPLEIDVGWTGVMHDIHIDSCYIASLENQLPYVGSRQTVLVKGAHGKTFFHNDTIIGSYDFTFNERREFKKCVLYSPNEVSGIGTSFIDSCEIHFHNPGLDVSGSFNLKAGQITNNKVFTNGGTINITSLTVINNYFEGNSRPNGGGMSIHRDNYFEGDLNYNVTSGTPSQINALLENNIIKGDAAISGVPSGPTYIANNSFFGNVSTSMTGNQIRFYHNNFKEGKWFNCQSWGEMINNNFGDVFFLYITGTYQGNPVIKLSNNNYNIQDSSSYFYTYYDDSPTYYNPEYDTLNGLHINNPAIYSSAEVLSPVYLTVDMDDEGRDQIRSIGSDETCLSIPLEDSMFFACGSVYTLSLCDSLVPGLHWGPTELMVDSMALFPEVLVDTIQTIYLIDDLGTILDSMVLCPFEIESRNRNLYGFCNINYDISTYNQEGASINWEPGYLFSDSTSFTTSITLDTTTIIVANQDLGQCGFRYDSITFHINTTPHGFIYVDTQSCLSVRFQSFTRCFDSTKWTISDGTTYTDVSDIWHDFPSNGYYEIIYTAWMYGEMDSDTMEIMVNCVGIEELDKWNFEVYPNPADDYLYLNVPDLFLGQSYSIFNITGQKVKSGIISDSTTLIDVSKFKNGSYLIEIDQARKKLIINSP